MVVAHLSSLALGQIDSPTWGDEVFVRWTASAGRGAHSMKTLHLIKQRFGLTGRTAFIFGPYLWLVLLFLGRSCWSSKSVTPISVSAFRPIRN
ncbi:MAG: hypothetical protein CBARDCOR_1021 [uncultured Caballeronia sp.]|nr:MAG: hypothetical protein CBARDCOR_1021 [uncultured Caballeronia sp.]